MKLAAWTRPSYSFGSRPRYSGTRGVADHHAPAEVSSLLQGPPIGVPLRLLQGLKQAEQNTEVLLQKALGHVRLSR